jgi:hypothetical protein
MERGGDESNGLTGEREGGREALQVGGGRRGKDGGGLYRCTESGEREEEREGGREGDAQVCKWGTGGCTGVQNARGR